MAEIESRLATLEQAFARIDEKLSILPKIEAQLAAHNSIYITKAECELQHKHAEEMRDELNKNIEKEIAVLRDECKRDIDGIASKYSSMINRIWTIFTPLIISVLTFLVIQAVESADTVKAGGFEKVLKK